jgi:hypothetical protein
VALGKRDTKARKAREVVGGLTSAEVTKMMLPPRGHIEVKEKKDYSFRVWYPDEGFVPCSMRCEIKHSHDYKQKMIESSYVPEDEADAMEYARLVAEGREIKVIHYQGIRKPKGA